MRYLFFLILALLILGVSCKKSTSQKQQVDVYNATYEGWYQKSTEYFSDNPNQQNPYLRIDTGYAVNFSVYMLGNDSVMLDMNSYAGDYFFPFNSSGEMLTYIGGNEWTLKLRNDSLFTTDIWNTGYNGSPPVAIRYSGAFYGKIKL